jgi:nucleotide-binding universal stress UspA family protein
MVITREPAPVAKKPAWHATGPVYRAVVVPLSDDSGSLAAVQTACAIAAPDGGSLVGVFVNDIPTELPLEAHMFEAEARAREALERARAAAEAYGLRFVGRIVRAHGAGEAIVAEAERLDADLIVLVAPRKPVRRTHGPVFDAVVRTVLSEAPSRVLVIAPPRTEESLSA